MPPFRESIPEDWCTNAYAIDPSFSNGIAATRKGSRKDGIYLLRNNNKRRYKSEVSASFASLSATASASDNSPISPSKNCSRV